MLRQRFLTAWVFLALFGIIPAGWAHVPTGKRDAENRLVKMGAASGVEPARELTFTYDWLGRRTSKTVWTNWNAVTGSFTLSNTVRFVWDDWRLVAELDATQNPGSPTLLRSYLWGADASGTVDGAAGVGGLVAFTDHTAGGGTWFTLTDGRGNVSALANATTGEVEGRLEYGPFGELLRAGGAAARLPLRWSTKYEDGEIGLIYYGRRYYDPATGRWLSRDPIGEEGGVNVYGFVGNDPVNRIDPIGLRVPRTQAEYAEKEEDLRALEVRYRQAVSAELAVLGNGIDLGKRHSFQLLREMDLVRRELEVFTRLDFDRCQQGGLLPAGEGLFAGEEHPLDLLTLPITPLSGAPLTWLESTYVGPSSFDPVTGRLRTFLGEGHGIKDLSMQYGEAAATAQGLGTLARLPMALARRGCARAALTPLALPAPRQISAQWGVNTYRHGGQMSAIEHINYRHAFNSGFKEVSRFAQGTSVRQIQGYVDDALRYGKVTPNGANGFQIEHTFGRAIGTDPAGNAASGIRVFVRDGNIQTAFPIP